MDNKGKEELIDEKIENINNDENKQGLNCDAQQKEPSPEVQMQQKEPSLHAQEPSPKVHRKIFKSIWNIISKLITILILLICIIIVVQKVTRNKESFFGYRIFRVLTGSMVPKYMVGDVILVKETDTDKIKIGDDVTYQGKQGAVNGIMVTHRVVDIEEKDGQRAFHTQGIANNLEDPIVYGEQINGVVQTKMYGLSLICKLVDNKYVFYFCGILPLTIYVCFKLFNWRSKEYYKEKVKKSK